MRGVQALAFHGGPEYANLEAETFGNMRHSWGAILTSQKHQRGDSQMKYSKVSKVSLMATAVIVGSGMLVTAQAQQANMSFFVTSVGKGKGADLGGLQGADAHCSALASAAGAANKNWHAYLSTTAPGGEAGVNARDRIGNGPWRNAKGVVVAENVNDLHSQANKINKANALTEKGEVVSGRGDPVNMHDILTGSDPAGNYSTAGGDTTCGNWTNGTAASAAEGSAIVGHHDLLGLKDTRHMKSWNSSHGSRGCTQDALKSSGGAGLFYCFAAN
jgi:hypothetical protein